MGQYINGEEVLITNQKEMPPRVCDAILAINADAKFTIINDNVDRLEWLENFTPISKVNITTKLAELQTAYNGIGVVQRKRKAEYPSIKDQLDDIYHNGIDAWKATIKITKDKYPKG